MKQTIYTKTPDLLPNHDLAGERPRKPTARELGKARIERFRAKHDVKAVTVNLPASLVAELDAWIVTKGKGKTKSQVVEKLIRTQLLRPR